MFRVHHEYFTKCVSNSLLHVFPTQQGLCSNPKQHYLYIATAALTLIKTASSSISLPKSDSCHSFHLSKPRGAAPTLACFSMYCLKSSSLSAELSTALYRGSVSSLSFTLLHRWPPSMCCSLRRSKKSCFT